MSPILPLPGGPGPGPRQLGESLDRLSWSFGGPPAGVLTAVFASWEDLVGDAVAAHARPTSLRHGTLIVVVDDPAWATQLRWLEADVLTALAGVAGEGVVEDIQVRVRRG